MKLNRRVVRHNIYSALHVWIPARVGGCRFAQPATELLVVLSLCRFEVTLGRHMHMTFGIANMRN